MDFWLTMLSTLSHVAVAVVGYAVIGLLTIEYEHKYDYRLFLLCSLITVGLVHNFVAGSFYHGLAAMVAALQSFVRAILNGFATAVNSTFQFLFQGVATIVCGIYGIIAATLLFLSQALVTFVSGIYEIIWATLQGLTTVVCGIAYGIYGIMTAMFGIITAMPGFFCQSLATIVRGISGSIVATFQFLLESTIATYQCFHGTTFDVLFYFLFITILVGLVLTLKTCDAQRKKIERLEDSSNDFTENVEENDKLKAENEELKDFCNELTDGIGLLFETLEENDELHETCYTQKEEIDILNDFCDAFTESLGRFLDADEENNEQVNQINGLNKQINSLERNNQTWRKKITKLRKHLPLLRRMLSTKLGNGEICHAQMAAMAPFLRDRVDINLVEGRLNFCLVTGLQDIFDNLNRVGKNDFPERV